MSKSKNSGGNKHTLTMRQLRFACEYAKSANGKGAARAAGYHGEDHSLEVQASRLLRNAEVLAKIEELRKPELEKAKVDLAHVVAELASVGFSDIGDIMDFDGATPRMKPVSALPERTRRAIASIKVRRVAGEEEIEVHEIKLWDKIAALRVLADFVGLSEQKSQQLNQQFRFNEKLPIKEAHEQILRYLRQHR